MDSFLGATVSHYRVLEQVGAGGMGVVYLAEDERLHRKVALKFIVPSSAGDALAQQRLLREAQAASALDHPNIATVYEVGDYESQLFIAMAYYQGETLRQRIDRAALPLADAAAIAAAVAEGLEAAHAANVVHRDLKPANVFITSSGQVKILDFGLAKMEAAGTDTTRVGVTEKGTTIGTLAYMAPEQVLGREVDQRADVWAFGVLLFEMLTGRQPFRGDTPAAVLLALTSETPPPLTSLRPDAPADLGRLVDAALVKEPERRTLTAGDIARTLRRYRERAQQPESSSLWRALRRPAIAVPLAATVIAIGGAVAVVGSRMADERWARITALPEIVRLAEAQQFVEATVLAQQAEQILHDDPALATLWPRITRTVTIRSEPDGANISYAPYGADAPWRTLGTTPLENVRLPLGVLRVKAEKPGFDAAEDVTFTGAGAAPMPSFTLAATGTSPEGMVRAAAPRAGFNIYVFGLATPRVRFGEFWIDRYEVSNRQYKAFVDAGGYTRRELWREPFVRDGRTLSFEEAMRTFRDATGRPGPAAWTLGSYAQGADDLPVTGVSWYEASAYAGFVGKSLPTAHHWFWVANQGLTGYVIPFGNFSSAAPVAVSRIRSLHRFGAYGLAGNVKEWCFNDTPDGRRYILGGGWDEPPYMFRDADARSPFDRGHNFGFRTVKYLDGAASIAALSGVLRAPSRSYEHEKPVADQVFEAYRSVYSYDKTDLAPVVESVDDGDADWRVEKVSFAAAYGTERVFAYVLLPKKGQPPYQTAIYMPNAGAWDQRTPPPLANPPFAFLLRSGRAAVLPIYKGTFERWSGDYHGGDELKATNRWRDYVIMFSKDLRRTIDYLATRPDIDSNRIAFFGVSRGAALAPMMLAPEPRIKAAALWIPGFYRETIAPEVDAINFAPRVTIPVLQLSGRYDYNFPDETSSLPFFQTLGTPAERKRRILYDTGHNLPANESIRETLDWFDQHLGVPR